MRKLVDTLKKWTKKPLQCISNHYATVCVSLILTIIFVSSWGLQEVGHKKEMLKIEKENIALREALDQTEKSFTDSWEVIRLQSDTIQKYENVLGRTQEALHNQSRLIDDLVKYLKKIKHWPPKEPRPEIDPSKWIIFIKE